MGRSCAKQRVLGKDLPGPSEARLQDQDTKIEAQSQKIAAMEHAIDQAWPVMSFLMVTSGMCQLKTFLV